MLKEPLRQSDPRRIAPSPSGRGRGVRGLMGRGTKPLTLTLSRWERGQKLSPSGRGDRAAWPHPKRTLEPDLGRNAQQCARIIAQDCRPLGVAQARGLENMLHGRARPRIGIVGAHDDLAGTALRYQMPQRLRGENDGVEIEIP